MSQEPRLKVMFHDKVKPALMETFKFSSSMQVPTMTKIVINVGLGDAKENARALESAVAELALITGRKAKVNKARKSIANFKLREGMAIGTSVTLRREAMWEFLDRFVAIVAPRMRDFRGLSDKCFDGMGNYNLGIKEQIVFPEIDYDKVERVHGMDIAFVTTAKSDEECKALLSELGMPFVKREQQ
jgi:large subunit ribosomal protein L5